MEKQPPSRGIAVSGTARLATAGGQPAGCSLLTHDLESGNDGAHLLAFQGE